MQQRAPIAPTRPSVLWRLLTQALNEVRPVGRAVTVLDCGGGSGRFAVPLAQLGARVTVVDVSVDALATLHRRAGEAGVGELVTGVQGEVEALDELDELAELNDLVDPAGFDLVLAHNVLQSLDSAERALTALTAAARPGALISVLLDNPVAGVLSRVLAGDVASALAELRRPQRLDLAEVQQLCLRVGLVVRAIHGIDVFSEWLPGTVTDADQPLAELEELATQRRPYLDLAARQHILAVRPAGD